MTDRNLRRRIQLGEDSELELKAVVFKGFKLVAPDRKDLADEMAAMANTRPGILVLGVDDKSREITGIPIDRLDQVESLVREACNDSVEPPLQVHILRLELPDSQGELQPLIKVEVPRSLFVHKSPGGYFHRIGSSKREMRPEQLARLFQQRSQARLIRFDEQAVPGTSPKDLSGRRLDHFVGASADEQATVLRKLKIITTDEDGSECLSVSGVLMATEHPETWLPNAKIEAAFFRGTHQDGHYQLDAATITGPLDQQILDACRFVRRNMRVAATKTPARVDYPQYSMRSVFEAIVNAVAHRDYSIHGSKIRLFMFDDRLELFSPGALPNSLTVDSMALRQATRNELVTSLLGRLPADPLVTGGRGHFMEKRGDGVPIILGETRSLSGREPTYRLIDDSELMLTLWAAESPHAG